MLKKIALGSIAAFAAFYVLFQAGYYLTSPPSFCASCPVWTATGKPDIAWIFM